MKSSKVFFKKKGNREEKKSQTASDWKLCWLRHLNSDKISRCVNPPFPVWQLQIQPQRVSRRPVAATAPLVRSSDSKGGCARSPGGPWPPWVIFSVRSLPLTVSMEAPMQGTAGRIAGVNSGSGAGHHQKGPVTSASKPSEKVHPGSHSHSVTPGDMQWHVGLTRFVCRVRVRRCVGVSVRGLLLSLVT